MRQAFVLIAVAALILAGCVQQAAYATPTPTPTPTPLPTATAPQPTADLKACSQDSDCVPSTCCHAPDCANRVAINRTVCTLLCTAVCEGPLDCGAGSCGCVSGRCAVVPAAIGK